MTPYPTSSHVTSPYLTSPHPISPHLTLYHLTLFHLTSCRPSPHIMSPHTTYIHITSPYLASHHFTLPCLTTLASPYFSDTTSRHIMTVHMCLQACAQEPQPVQEAYSALLDRTGGDQTTPDVRSPILRMRVLKSAHSVLLARQDWLEQQQCVQSDFRQLQRREVGIQDSIAEQILRVCYDVSNDQWHLLPNQT